MADIQPGVNYDAVNALYNQHLGRSASQDEYTNWANGTYGASDLAGIGSQIAGSGEAAAYRQRQPTSSTQPVAPGVAYQGQTFTNTAPAYQAPTLSQADYNQLNPSGPQATAARAANPSLGAPTYGGNPNDPAYIQSVLRQWGGQPGVNPSVNADPGYWQRRMLETGGLQPSNLDYWQRLAMTPEGGRSDAPSGGGGAMGGGQGYSGTSVFSDPATQQYESLINSLIGRLNTPYQAPHFQQSIDQLNTYLQQLNGPAYTPQQQDILQTQALDPIERQRQQQKQQALTRLGTRGIGPSSGIAESALQGVDNSFNTIDANTRAGLATNQIGVQRQNAAQAAQLAPQIAALEAGQYGSQTNNMLQGVNLASIIPQTAWSRLTGANSLIQPLNPATLLNQQLPYQQQGYNQSADYMSQLMQILGGLFA